MNDLSSKEKWKISLRTGFKHSLVSYSIFAVLVFVFGSIMLSSLGGGIAFLIGIGLIHLAVLLPILTIIYIANIRITYTRYPYITLILSPITGLLIAVIVGFFFMAGAMLAFSFDMQNRMISWFATIVTTVIFFFLTLIHPLYLYLVQLNSKDKEPEALKKKEPISKQKALA